MVRRESAAAGRTLSYFLPAPLLCSLSIVDQKVAPAAAPLAGVLALCWLGFLSSRLERLWPLDMVIFPCRRRPAYARLSRI